MSVDIRGYVAPGFGGVADTFAGLFQTHGETGAAVAAYVDGKPAISIAAGEMAPGVPWETNTMATVFSVTKGLTATCVHHFVEQSGFDLDAPIAAVWPEFANNGKENISLRSVMSHRAGLPIVEGDFTLDEALSWWPVVNQLATQAPIWEPGTAHGYHLRSYGWLIGETLRRASGLTVSQYFSEHISGPLGLDWYLGLPESLDHQAATLVTDNAAMRKMLMSLPEDMVTRRAMLGPSDLFHYDDMWNTRQLRAAELPSSSSIGSAESIARMYAGTIGEVDGIRLLSDSTVANACVEQSNGPDRTLMIDTSFGTGYMIGASAPAACGPRAFGHGGAGGSTALADPDIGLGVAYVPGRLRFDPDGNERAELLVASIMRAATNA